ncbi:hypothetical protein HZC33_00905 [Candidatus Wolfebacteria bacterium]|nr:hypothetical protein [Candidatus Wolfebacteria bacterium]
MAGQTSQFFYFFPPRSVIYDYCFPACPAYRQAGGRQEQAGYRKDFIGILAITCGSKILNHIPAKQIILKNIPQG